MYAWPVTLTCMDETLLTEQQLADRLQVALKTVQRWRTDGTGPPVYWAGDRPRYRWSEVEEWLKRPRREQGRERRSG
jgi:predicted site-specific integrase-resolvase